MPGIVPRVLVVVRKFPALYETGVIDHVRGLLRAGWDVRLACLELDVGLLAEHRELVASLPSIHVLGPDAARPSTWLVRATRLARAGRQVVRTRPSSLLRRSAYLAPALTRIMGAVRPDVVHAHWGHDALPAAAAASRHGVPLVAELHGFDITTLVRADGWDAYREHLARHTVLVHSEFARKLVREGIGVEPELIRYGVDDVFRFTPRPSSWPTPLRLASIGRLVPEKGHDTVLEAVAQLRARRPALDVRLTIAGSGPSVDELGRMAQRLGIADRVRFVGRLLPSDVAALLAATDVLLVASRESDKGWVEAYGRIAAEGVATGTAVIASRSGGLPDAVGDAATLVDPDDPVSIADALLALIDENAPDAIARRTRARAAMLTIDRYWAEMDALDRRVAGMPR
jgi:colanic acid/amylovoran biosynthesis glycosyltransferase